MATVLIADDEANLRRVLSALLEKDGHDTVAVSDGHAALEAIDREAIDVVITDVRMPRMGGLELLEAINARRRVGPAGRISPLPVIVITAHGTEDTAISALRRGAVDYIRKPFDKEELRLAVRKALAARQHGDPPVPGSPPGTKDEPHLLGRSDGMRNVLAIIDKVAATPSTVLITGESGTGKELVAGALHSGSERRDAPLIKVNCAAIPRDLMESEFFGHEKGAFTGAVESKPGRFELADGGTLFLDEIGELSNEIQVKLLRALQYGEFERVGGVRTLQVDVRLIAATNRDLSREIERGTFREDLFYRLNVVPIALPPLRDRAEDIPLLVETFLEKCNRRLDRNCQGISEEAMELLRRHCWPGNIRELENVIERGVLFAEGPTIVAQDLPAEIRSPSRPPVGGPPTTPVQAERLDETNTSMKDIVRQATVAIEKDLIVRALEQTEGNVTRAASLLQISRKGLQNKMKEFGLREREEED